MIIGCRLLFCAAPFSFPGCALWVVGTFGGRSRDDDVEVLCFCYARFVWWVCLFVIDRVRGVVHGVFVMFLSPAFFLLFVGLVDYFGSGAVRALFPF